MAMQQFHGHRDCATFVFLTACWDWSLGQSGETALKIPENYTVTGVDVVNHPVIAAPAAGISSSTVCWHCCIFHVQIMVYACKSSFRGSFECAVICLDQTFWICQILLGDCFDRQGRFDRPYPLAYVRAVTRWKFRLAPISADLPPDHPKSSLMECWGTATTAQGLACSWYSLTPVLKCTWWATGPALKYGTSVARILWWYWSLEAIIYKTCVSVLAVYVPMCKHSLMLGYINVVRRAN